MPDPTFPLTDNLPANLVKAVERALGISCQLVHPRIVFLFFETFSQRRRIALWLRGNRPGKGKPSTAIQLMRKRYMSMCHNMLRRNHSMLKIERVSDFSPLREAVYRLRYTIFNDELHSNQKYIDHNRRIIRDPLDDTCHLYAVVDDGKVVGTMRWNAAANSDLEEYYQGMRIDPGDYQDACLASKIAIAASHRGTAAIFGMAATALVDGLNHGMRYALIRCEPALVSFYERCGFQLSHRVPWNYRAGCREGAVMVFDGHDEEHLRRVGSPVLSHCRAWAARKTMVCL
jgi:hypothetical protein